MSVSAAIRRHVIFRAHEWLVGRHTLDCARELEATQWLAPAALRTLQQQKLIALLNHARKRVPYYRNVMIPNHVDLHADWSRIPLLAKADITLAGNDLCSGDARGLRPSCTGGSTGEPLTFYLDRRRQAYDQAARIRSHRWFGVELGDCEVLLWGSPIERNSGNRLRSVRDRLFNQHLLDAFRMSPERMDQYLDRWDRLRPVALFGYPSSIALFARHAQDRRRTPDLRRLRAVFVTGEVCYPQDRADIESVFQAPVADGYGSREAGFIAHQCPKGSMHITAENVFVEIIRDGAVLPPGETGEIVITHLDAYGMPFIRYRTGDQGRLLSGRCACGRGLPLMDVVQGRSTDFLTLPDGTIKHALSIIYPLRETPGLRQFRVTQQPDYAVTVEVVAERSVTTETLLGRVRPVLGGDVPIGIRFVQSLDEAPSGKFRYVISHVRNTRDGVPT